MGVTSPPFPTTETWESPALPTLNWRESPVPPSHPHSRMSSSHNLGDEYYMCSGLMLLLLRRTLLATATDGRRVR